MTEPTTLEREQALLFRCIEEPYEALRQLPGVDANGPILVWLAEQLKEAHKRSASDAPA
jgi:hypothetical protein